MFHNDVYFLLDITDEQVFAVKNETDIKCKKFVKETICWAVSASAMLKILSWITLETSVMTVWSSELKQYLVLIHLLNSLWQS